MIKMLRKFKRSSICHKYYFLFVFQVSSFKTTTKIGFLINTMLRRFDVENKVLNYLTLNKFNNLKGSEM